MWEDNVNRDLKVVKINHCNKQAKGRNGWKQITEQVNEDLQSAVERLDLVPVKGKTGGEKMLTEWVTVANINCFREKMFGFISNMSVTRIAKEKLLQKEIQDLSLSVT